MIKCPSCERDQQPWPVVRQLRRAAWYRTRSFRGTGTPAHTHPLIRRRLEQIYHDFGRRIHPDRFANGSVKTARRESARHRAADARLIRTLRDPVSRGLYWLELNGHKLAENNKSVPAILAEMVFEVQEQLADLRAARDDSTGEAARLRGRDGRAARGN